MTGDCCEETKTAPAPAEVDIYRDTPLRYAGYANEVGEAFRALVSVGFVRATYGVASAYVLPDTADKATKMSKEKDSDTKKVALAAFDTLVWQAFASVIVPGFTINRICAYSLAGMANAAPRGGEQQEVGDHRDRAGCHPLHSPPHRQPHPL